MIQGLAIGQGQRIAGRLGLLEEVQKVTTWLWFRQVGRMSLEGKPLHNIQISDLRGRIN